MTTTVSKPGQRSSLRERLLGRAVIDMENGCWLWTGTKNQKGYGRISIADQMQQTHRVAYELIEGPIPAGLQLDHLCRVRHCINPAHLEPVTNRENTIRSFVARSASNAAKTHCKSGHELSPENTFGSGKKRCKACDFNYYEAHREQINARKCARRAAERKEATA